jgi:hypothetical protein
MDQATPTILPVELSPMLVGDTFNAARRAPA